MKARISFTVLLTVSILLVSFASILFAEELSQPVYKVIEEKNVMVEMRDGVRLATDIYRPDAEGAFPALLVRTPYNKEAQWTANDAPFFAVRGYCVIIQDCRGTYASEGVFDALHPESFDGFDTQEWVGVQPWCSGKIGAYGPSYLGATQWMPAPLGSNYLVAMCPEVTFADTYDMFAYYGGAFRLQLVGGWSSLQVTPYVIPSDTLMNNWTTAFKHLPLLEMDTDLGWRIPYLRTWLAHPDKDVYWRGLSINNEYSSVKTSTLNIGGWFDIFLKGTIANFTGMTGSNITPGIRRKQKLLIGPWIHIIPNNGKVGALDFGDHAGVDLNSIRLRWFDSRLKGLDNGVMDEPPVKLFVMGTNTWRFENEWPLARTNYQKFYFHSNGDANTLHGSGRLDTTIPGNETVNKFVYDPENPVPSVRDPLSNPLWALGPCDQRSVEERDDVLVYSTPPLQEDIEVTGPIEVILYAASSAVNTDFTAKLNDVYPDGRSMRLCEGIIRTTHRNGPGKLSFIEPGEVYEYHIDLWATSNVFKKGHQIRVEISSSSFPRFDRNLNTTLYNALGTEMAKAEQTIYHNEKYPSCIVLPLIPK